MYPNCLFEAREAYLKAFELETNVKKQKDFGTPLTMIASYLLNEGVERFNNKKYEDAYKHFDAARTANEFLVSKGLATIDTTAIYATSMAGLNLQKNAEVKPLLEKLVAMNYDNVAVYENLADIYEKDKNTTELAALVKKGLAKYPNSKGLMFIELNQTLSDGGDVQKSIEQLEKASSVEPNNVNVWAGLASAYEKVKMYDKAIAAYDKAIALKPDYGDAYFNVGIIFFNQGVEFNKQMNVIDDKDDKDGKKYAALKVERDAALGKALPYLEKAYATNTKNPDYKSSLKKVYATLNMLDKAKALGE